MTPTQIVTEMKKAIASAESVHISGTGTSGGTQLSLDLRLARDKGGAGHVELGGFGFDIVRIDQKLYFKADAKALDPLRRERGGASCSPDGGSRSGRRRAASAPSRRSPTSRS